MSPLVSYLFAAMVAWSPLERHSFAEGRPVTEARYLEIASSVAAVSAEADPLFAGGDGRARTAVLLLSIASFESGGFAGDVQSWTRRGDQGRARGLWQTHTTWAESCTTVHEAARVALERLRASVAHCSVTGQAPETWLAEYASGRCDHGWSAARRRWDRAAEWLRGHPLGGAS